MAGAIVWWAEELGGWRRAGLFGLVGTTGASQLAGGKMKWFSVGDQIGLSCPVLSRAGLIGNGSCLEIPRRGTIITIRQAGLRAHLPQLPGCSLVRPGRAISKLLLLLLLLLPPTDATPVRQTGKERQRRAGSGMGGWRNAATASRAAASLAFCTCACACWPCTLAAWPWACESCRLLPPISTSEPLLPLRGAASCVSSRSSQCRDFHVSPED